MDQIQVESFVREDAVRQHTETALLAIASTLVFLTIPTSGGHYNFYLDMTAVMLQWVTKYYWTACLSRYVKSLALHDPSSFAPNLDGRSKRVVVKETVS